MTTLRAAAQQALEALEAFLSDELRPYEAAKTAAALKDALAEPEGGGNLPPPLQEPTVAETATTQRPFEETPPSEYRRGYWDGFAIGKREGRIEAEDALAEPSRAQQMRDAGYTRRPTLREMAEPAQEPVQDVPTPKRGYTLAAEPPDPTGCYHCRYFAKVKCLVCGRGGHSAERSAAAIRARGQA